MSACFFRVVLGVVVAGTALIAPAGPAAAAPGVTPESVTLNLDPGGSTSVDRTVSTPAIPPKPDIVFLVDTTASMGSVIANVQANSQTIQTDIASAQPDAQFAVAQYRDVLDPSPFDVVQDLTTDQAAVNAGLRALTPEGGGDDPEDGINGLFEVSTGKISFRPGSSRIVLLIGDQPSHNPSLDHSLDDAISALIAASVTVLAIDMDVMNSTGQATAIKVATHGEVFSGIVASTVSTTIRAALHNLPVTVTHTVSNCDPALAVTLAPDSLAVTSGDNVTFAHTIAVSPSAIPGTTLTCSVNFLLNGTLSAGFTESIIEQVPKASPAVAAAPSAGVPAGGDVSDSATVSGGFVPTGTVTFELFGPGDTGCATPIATRTASLAGGTAASGNVPAGGVGTYRWVSRYSGDTHNNPAVSACGSAQVVVVKASPGIATTPSDTVPAGGNISDSATMPGGFEPAGTVTFQLFGPGDIFCAKPLATRTGTVSAATAPSGPVASGPAGTYRWAATYSGDANNNGAAAPCGSGQVVVTPQLLTGRASGLSAHASLRGTVLANVPPTPDTGRISTTTSTGTSPPCVATVSGPISAHGLCAQVTTIGFPARSVTSASVDDTTVSITNIPAITMTAIRSTSTTTCAGSTGTTTIGFLKVGNVVVIGQPTNVAPNTAVTVGGVKLMLNEQTPISRPTAGLSVIGVRVTVTAATLGLPSANAVVASAESALGNCPT